MCAKTGNKTNDFGALTHVGLVREHNEDALIVSPPLYAVADGMGGHAAGEVASEIAINTLAENAPLICDSGMLIETIARINQAIIDAARTGIGRPGMGTTLTAAILDGNRLLVAQVGDSRAYLLHDGNLQQLTRDHSYVGELLALGHISEQEAATHVKRSVITRALGADPKTEADIYEVELTVGDRLLLCTDGLSGMLSDADIAALLQENADPQAATIALVEAANQAGGMDNISVVVVDVNTDKSSFLRYGDDTKAVSHHEHNGDAVTGDKNPRTRWRSLKDQKSETRNTPGRRLHLGVITFALLIVLLIGGAVGGTWLYASNSTFLRTLDGQVAVYRGLPGDILPGLRLEWLEYETDIEASALLASTAERLKTGIQVDSLAEAKTLVASYEQQVTERKALRGTS
ncbi:MAG: Stp1/IreP family PP2C-type Ser/Thr phosphatase [Coriobacteriales bacterium]|jgi:protein phosphatase|nr:Stp1/IreP family PP2C-type Ser/Thr phosphatase [Coriobacteriales bacterium]